MLLNKLDYNPKPGDFVMARQGKKGWNPFWQNTWGIYLCDCKEKKLDNQKWVICMDADNIDKPRFWRGLFGGQIAFDEAIGNGWGIGQYQNTLEVRKALKYWIKQAKLTIRGLNVD